VIDARVGFMVLNVVRRMSDGAGDGFVCLEEVREECLRLLGVPSVMFWDSVIEACEDLERFDRAVSELEARRLLVRMDGEIAMTPDGWETIAEANAAWLDDRWDGDARFDRRLVEIFSR
jgi:hypothetical protein